MRVTVTFKISGWAQEEGVPEKRFDGESEIDIAMDVPTDDLIDAVEDTVNSVLRSTLTRVCDNVQKRIDAYVEHELKSGLKQTTLELTDGEDEPETP